MQPVNVFRSETVLLYRLLQSNITVIVSPPTTILYIVSPVYIISGINIPEASSAEIRHASVDVFGLLVVSGSILPVLPTRKRAFFFEEALCTLSLISMAR